MGDLYDTYKLLQGHWAVDMGNIELVSSQPQSSYHSRAASVENQMCLALCPTSYSMRCLKLSLFDSFAWLTYAVVDICYNISESLVHVVNETHMLDSNTNIDSGGPMDVLSNIGMSRYIFGTISPAGRRPTFCSTRSEIFGTS